MTVATEKIPSPVTGIVWKQLVQVGDQLAVGDTLYLVESMKMEIPVTMPRDGRVTALLVKEEDSVTEHQDVAEIE